MESRTQEQIENALRSRLHLQEPVFHLEVLPSGSVSGSIVSDTFAGVEDLERQRQIWDALDGEFGPQSSRIVGTLLAYSKAEWDWDSTEVEN